MKKKLRIDVDRLVRDCGGVHLVQSMTGIGRTAIYSIFRRQRMTSDQLAAILNVFRNVDIREYIVEAPTKADAK